MEEKLINEIAEMLQIELKSDPDFSMEVLMVKIKKAIKDVRKRRNYKASSFDEEEIAKDLYENYFSIIYDVALFDYGQIGAFGELQHSENGILRSYQNRDRLFADVTPFVEFL